MVLDETLIIKRLVLIKYLYQMAEKSLILLILLKNKKR